MASTILHPTLSIGRAPSRLSVIFHAVPHAVTQLLSSIWQANQTRRKRRFDSQQMGELSLHVLRDLNADDWMHGRTLERKEMERYERAQATMPFKHIL